MTQNNNLPTLSDFGFGWGVGSVSEMMPDIGQELRAARLTLGLGIEPLANELCICSRQLRALENNRHDELPGAAYVIGFLRTYSQRLGLNADRIVAQYKDLHGGPEVKTPLQFPEPVRETRIPAMSLMVAGTLALVGMYAGWASYTGGGVQEASIVPSPPARLVAFITPESESIAPESPVDSASDSVIDSTDAPETGLQKSDSTAVEKIFAATSEKQKASKTNAASSLVSSAIAVEVGPLTPAMGVSRIQVQANDDTWIMITDQDDRLIMEGIIRSGERYAPPAIPGLKLSASNAGGLEMFVDGRSSGELGGWGEVAKDVPLEIERIAALYR